MVEVTVKLPENDARSFGVTAEEVGRRLLEDAAIEGYRAGRLSHRQIGELLGLDYWQTENFLSERHVALNYSASDLAADRQTLKNLLGDK